MKGVPIRGNALVRSIVHLMEFRLRQAQQAELRRIWRGAGWESMRPASAAAERRYAIAAGSDSAASARRWRRRTSRETVRCVSAVKPHDTG